MNLTQEEKEQLLNCSTKKDWYAKCDEIKSRRNNIYPSDLSREIVDLYQTKFSEDNTASIILGAMMTRSVFMKAFGVSLYSMVSWLPIGWMAFAGATGLFFTSILRLFFPNVLFEPPQSFKIGFPEDFEVGKVSLRFKKDFNVWIVRDAEKIIALSTVCTHLGCTPNWLETDQKFKCPCHGSGFKISGVNFEGPAPRPLERYRIYLANDGQVVVDKTKKFQYEKGEWNRAESFLKV